MHTTVQKVGIIKIHF